MKRYLVGWPEYYKRRGAYRFMGYEIINTNDITFSGKKIKVNGIHSKLKADLYDTDERAFLKQDYGDILDKKIQKYLQTLVLTRVVLFEKYNSKRKKRKKRR